jgi:hypothetical protein
MLRLRWGRTLWSSRRQSALPPYGCFCLSLIWGQRFDGLSPSGGIWPVRFQVNAPSGLGWCGFVPQTFRFGSCVVSDGGQLPISCAVSQLLIRRRTAPWYRAPASSCMLGRKHLRSASMRTGGPRPPPLLEAERLRRRAAEIRGIAEGFKDASVKRAMLDVADPYDRLADNAEQYPRTQREEREQ